MTNKIKIISLALVVLVSVSIYYFSRTEEVIVNYPSTGTDIIAFGDSLVQGVGSTDGNDFISLLSQKIGRPIINLGKSGDTTVDGVARIKELDDYDPQVVILLLGGNDYLRKIPVTETRENLTSLIENIQARGAIVLLLGIRGGLLGDPFEEEFEILRDTYGVALVPDVLDGLFANTKYMSDAIHPNDAGYKLIAEKIEPVLLRIIE